MKMSISASPFNHVPFANDPPKTTSTIFGQVYLLTSFFVSFATVFIFLISLRDGSAAL